MANTAHLQFVGNINAHHELVRWCEKPLQHQYLCKEHVCLVAGGPGIGKSEGIVSAVQIAGKQIIILNKDLCNNSKEFTEYFLKVTRSNVIMHFSQASIQDFVLFVDDIETLLAVDRTFINNFNELHNLNVMPIKIVVSCHISELKALTKSLMFGHCIVLNTPSEADIIGRIHYVFADQPQSVGFTDGVHKIVRECKGNLSAAITHVQLMLAGGNVTSENAGSDAGAGADFNPKCNDVFPEVAKIYQLSDRSSIRSTLDLDPWLHPLRFHENIMHEWNTRHGTKKSKEVAYSFVLKCLCEWDQMMSHGKRGVDDFLKDTQTYAIEHISSAVLTVNSFKKKTRCSKEASMDEFTRMFNYLSLKKKNQLALNDSTCTVNNSFPWNKVGSLNKRTYDTFMKSLNKASKKKVRNTT